MIEEKKKKKKKKNQPIHRNIFTYAKYISKAAK
jgi:ribosomal protein S30